MAQEVKRTITIETKKSENKLREFRKEMTRLRGELVELEEGTEEYNRTLTELSNRQQKLNDIQEDIRTSMQDLGARINNLNRVTRGAVGGFTAIQGAINLLGASDTALEPMLKQMTNLLSIIEGLEQIEGLTKSIPQLINSFKGFGQELSDWFGNLFGGIDNRIEEAADNIINLEDNFKDINIDTDFVEPLDEANKKIQEAGEGTRRINDFVEPIGPELDKVAKGWESISQSSKTTAEKIAQVANIAKELDGEPLERMQKAAKLLGYDFNELVEDAKKAKAEFGSAAEVTKNAGNGLTFMAKATNVASKAWKTLGYAMKTLGLTIIVTALAEAAIWLWKNWDKVTAAFGKTKAMKDAKEALDKLRESLAAVNQELYPETNKSKLADAYSEAIRRRIDLEEELVRLEEKYAKLPKTIYQGPMFGTTTNPELLKTERQITKVKKQLEELRVEMKKTDTALKTYGWKEKQEAPLVESTTTTKEKDPTLEEVIDKYAPDWSISAEDIIRQVADSHKKRLEKEKLFTDELNRIRKEAGEEAARIRQEQIAKEKAALEQEQEFNKKRVQGIYDSVQAIGDITYGLSQIYYAAAQKDDLSDKQREERLKKYRAFLIATAAIDTAVSTAKAVQAAIGAMADTPGPIWTRVAAWGSVLATGLAGVAQMVSAFNSVNLSSGSSVASVTPPNVQTPPVAYTRNLLTDEETDQLNKSTRVYVLESDITNAQNAVKATVTNATF